MEKYIASLTGQAFRSRATARTKVTGPSTSFADQLQAASGRPAARNQENCGGNVLLVGEISRTRRTVSELLLHNRELRDSTWNILSSSANSTKDYTRLAPGTKIYYNREDGSLSWSGEKTMQPAEDFTARQAAASAFPTARAPFTIADGYLAEKPSGQKVEIGRISRQSPTVSHLLKTHAGFADDTWNILAAGVNRGKNFTSLPVGTVVTIDPATREISWSGGASGTAAAQPETAIITEPKAIAAIRVDKGDEAPVAQATDLTEAVRPYFGRHYREINCYELLVKGLERMNIPYRGKDGLFAKLTRMAREQGLPTNAYLNGEGVVKAAGSLVLAKNYPHTSNWRREADKLYAEMEPLLDRGQILSFSTRRRGHTGIVSHQQSQWTFINSGRLDNSLTKGSPSQGVGEENLKQEIRNWFRLASRSGDSLSVTLGTLGGETVATAFSTENHPAISQRI